MWGLWERKWKLLQYIRVCSRIYVIGISQWLVRFLRLGCDGAWLGLGRNGTHLENRPLGQHVLTVWSHGPPGGQAEVTTVANLVGVLRMPPGSEGGHRNQQIPDRARRCRSP